MKLKEMNLKKIIGAMSVFLLLVTFAQAQDTQSSADQSLVDPSQCAGTAVKAAVVAAKKYTEYKEKINYLRILTIAPSVPPTLQVAKTTYEINLQRWQGKNGFSMVYGVIVKGSKPNCKVIDVELLGEE